MQYYLAEKSVAQKQKEYLNFWVFMPVKLFNISFFPYLFNYILLVFICFFKQTNYITLFTIIYLLGTL